jgi:hypothetical protein
MRLPKIIYFCIQWILVTTVSYAVIIAFTFNHMEKVVATSQETLFGGLFLSGCLCGLGQWRLIENQSPGMSSWVIINILGMPLGLISGFFVYSGFETLLVSALPARSLLLTWLYEFGTAVTVLGTFFFAGIFLGVLQWLALRRKVNGAFWWIPVSGLSWSLGLYLHIKILHLLPVTWSGHHLRIGALLGTIIGVIIGTTGAIAIGVMLNNPKQSSNQIESTLSHNAS